MKSIWKPGTRVRVKENVDLAGEVGVVEEVEYAQTSAETSVLIDGINGGCWFRDDELEAE
ncbi:hypothetical protein ACIQUL_36340 [Streptomyces sp. NPDC090303]|uniref:hypothetical protein n=1 Tax=Streptomyces sp. NPDC090303 TaxID=3365960 RepID=UPI0037FAC19A